MGNIKKEFKKFSNEQIEIIREFYKEQLTKNELEPTELTANSCKLVMHRLETQLAWKIEYNSISIAEEQLFYHLLTYSDRPELIALYKNTFNSFVNLIRK